MKLRLLAALALIVALLGVGGMVAFAHDRPPSSWEKDNPDRCPYPHVGTPPVCDWWVTPDPGSRPYLGTSPEARP